MINRKTLGIDAERFFGRWLVMAVFALCLCLPKQVFAVSMVKVYSHRQQVLIQPCLDAFTEATGIETKNIYAAKGLAQRLQAEGAASPSDVILTLDIAPFAEYAVIYLLPPVDSAVLTAKNYEHPVNPAVAPTIELASYGTFKRNELPIKRLAALAADAQIIIDRVGW